MTIGLIIIGCITGFISAFFGIGGSSIDTPLLRTFLGFSPFVALGTPLPLTLLTAIIAFLTYGKKHLVNFKVVKLSLLGGIPCIIVGSYLSGFFPGKFLMLLTATVLFLVGVDFIYKRFFTEEQAVSDSEKKQIAAAYIISVSALIGIISGILANAGGIFFVPAYVILFKMRMKEAVATSLLTVAAMSIPGSLIHFSLGHIDLVAAAAIGIGVVPMAYLGAKVDILTESKTLRLLFGTLLIIFSVYFFINQLKA
jgi:uncharacterized protein